MGQNPKAIYHVCADVQYGSIRGKPSNPIVEACPNNRVIETRRGYHVM